MAAPEWSVEELSRVLREDDLWSAGAFGNPDGHRADLAEFIEFPHNFAAADRTRILVGRKGSGKTLYLRHLKDVIDKSPSVESLGPSLTTDFAPNASISETVEQTQLLMTHHVLRVAHWFPPAILTEIWMQLWGRAIIRSLLTYVLFDKRLRRHLDLQLREELRTHYSGRVLGSASRTPRTPFTCIKELIDSGHSAEDLIRHLDRPEWDDLENELGEILAELPPAYLYIDAVDEEFSHAPMYWLRCQKGLFYQTMRFLRHSRLGGRLHVIVCIRDLVLSSVYQSEHGTRYMNDPHIRRLSWKRSSAERFLDEKIRRLDSSYCFEDTQPSSLAEWVGLRTVRNSLGTEESVEAYALRHTQMLPREIVLLGNLLGRAVESLRASRRSLEEEEFRSVVSNVALITGASQLAVAANQIISDEIPEIASDREFTEVYTSIREYVETRATELAEVMRSAGSLEISADRLNEIEEVARTRFGGSDVGSVLWQNGLLGYRENDRAVFYSFDLSARFSLPRGHKIYVFHPAMRECAGLNAGTLPVDPWLE